MNWILWSFALSLLATGCSLLAAVFCARRTPTATGRKALQTALACETALAREIELMHATRERWSSEFAGIAERCDETLDRAESKRRRIAASESKAKGSNGQAHPGGDPWEGMSRTQIIDAGRRIVRGG